MNKLKQIEIKKASIFGLRAWRKEHGYTTPEWEAYVKANSDLTAILIAVGFVIGLFAGRL